MNNFERFKAEKQINNVFNIKQQQKYWTKIFQIVYEGKIDAWDYQWAYACFINNGLCIMPNVNLVSNIGFGSDSTHTKDKNSILSEVEAREITDIIHPNFISADQEADLLTSKISYGNKHIVERAKNKALRMIKKLYEM